MPFENHTTLMIKPAQILWTPACNDGQRSGTRGPMARAVPRID